jgi:hypothetical protein
MSKKLTAILSVLVFCIVIVAQEPVVDIDRNRHPDLAEAQRLVVEANRSVAQAENSRERHDYKGHLGKARELLVQVNQELKWAAQADDAALRK